MRMIKLISIVVLVLLLPLVIQSIVFNYFSLSGEVIYIVLSLNLLCFALPVFKKILNF